MVPDTPLPPISEKTNAELIQLLDTFRYDNDERSEYDFYMIVDWDLDALKKNGHMVKAFKQMKHGIHITFVDPQKALELLGKFHVLFTDKVQIDTAEHEIVQLIRDGEISYERVVEKGGDSLADRLFKQAGVEIGKE